MHFSNYREFYPKALIPMNETDRLAINDHETGLTHWLLSLEGYPRDTNKGFYLWEVAIYPSDCEGTFDWNTPLYKSALFDSFDDAYETALHLERKCQSPTISMINYIE